MSEVGGGKVRYLNQRSPHDDDDVVVDDVEGDDVVGDDGFEFLVRVFAATSANHRFNLTIAPITINLSTRPLAVGMTSQSQLASHLSVAFDPPPYCDVTSEQMVVIEQAPRFFAITHQ